MALPHNRPLRSPELETALARIELPPEVPVTEDEIARRRALYDEAMALVAEMRPLGISTAELIHQVRGEEDCTDC
ncbi:MAG: hypothetical protein ACRDJW_13850 [Thermomicrobiales bacterium]